MNSKTSGLNPKIYNSALKLLSIRVHGTEELRRKLLKKGTAEDTEAVIAELVKKKYLDDKEFAFLRARASCIHKRWGKLRIIRDLKNLGLDDKIIGISVEQAESELPEKERLEKVITIYQRLHGKPASIKDVKKLFDHCIRMGYPPESVRGRLDIIFSSITWD